MFIIVTNPNSTEPDSSIRGMSIGTNHYATRDEAFARVDEMKANHARTKQALDLLAQNDGDILAQLQKQAFDAAGTPEFVVMELVPVERVDVSTLPKIVPDDKWTLPPQ